MLRVQVGQPALILVDRGIKSVCTERGIKVQAQPGQAIVLEGNQTVDFTNNVPEGTHYEARWLLFDDALLNDAYYRECVAQRPANSAPAQLLAHLAAPLVTAFESVRQALPANSGVPNAVVRQRALEVMHWLLECGIVLRTTPLKSGTAVRVRMLIAARLDHPWTADKIAAQLAMSEATLQRRLADEGASLKDLLVDARMSTALTLLQATNHPVADIALSVGYESASRFAVRFRQRFGFAPTAIRGHERAI
jgi:AraC-like DNA-binding protein